jgi:Flp pilus assembly protein TadG
MTPGRGGDRGAVLVFVGTALFGLLAMTAIVLDLGNARQMTRQAQAATDAGALAGARELPIKLTDPDITAKQVAARQAAADYVLQDLFNGTPPALTPVSTTGDTWIYTADDATITVTTPVSPAAFGFSSTIPSHSLVYAKACRPTPTGFGKAVGLTSPNICREAVARKRQIDDTFGRGLIALDPAACPGMSIQGSATVDLTSAGAVIVDSSCTAAPTRALDGSGSSWEITAGLVSVVGTTSIEPCSPPATCTNVVPLTGQPPNGDPLRDLPEPDPPIPTYTSLAGIGGGCVKLGGSYLCSPGTYDVTLNFSGNDDVTFLPGLYYLNAGLDTTGNVTLTGVDVMFFNKAGEFDLSGTAGVNFSAPDAIPVPDPVYEGISVFQARDNTSLAKITGNPGMQIGTVYFPNARLELGGNDEINVNGMVIGDTVNLFGSAIINISAEEPPNTAPPDIEVGLER